MSGAKPPIPVDGAEVGVRPSARRAVLVYNAERLGLLLGAVLLGWVAGLRGVLLLVAAAAVSGVTSWFLLARQRAQMSVAVEAALRSRRERALARVAAEDAYVDALHAGDPQDANR